MNDLNITSRASYTNHIVTARLPFWTSTWASL